MMPAAIKDLYIPLESELIHLHLFWYQYRALFCATEKDVLVLNTIASLFFGTLQPVLTDHLVLAICRLATDPLVDRRGDENLTFHQLASAVAKHAVTKPEKKHADKMTRRAETIKDSAQHLKQWRHKRVAHKDLKTIQALLAGKSQLTGPKPIEVDGLLKQMRNFLDDVAIAYGVVPVSVAGFDRLPGDANALIDILRKWGQHKDEQRSRLMHQVGKSGLEK
jgi:hypothetical protein